MWITEHQRQELAALKVMLETDGWKVFIREMMEEHTRLNQFALQRIENEQQLFYCKGVNDVLAKIVNYDKIVEANDRVVQGEDE